MSLVRIGNSIATTECLGFVTTVDEGEKDTQLELTYYIGQPNERSVNVWVPTSDLEGVLQRLAPTTAKKANTYIRVGDNAVPRDGLVAVKADESDRSIMLTYVGGGFQHIKVAPGTMRDTVEWLLKLMTNPDMEAINATPTPEPQPVAVIALEEDDSAEQDSKEAEAPSSIPTQESI